MGLMYSMAPTVLYTLGTEHHLKYVEKIEEGQVSTCLVKHVYFFYHPSSRFKKYVTNRSDPGMLRFD